MVALATAEAERFNAIDIPLAAAPETAASASLLEKAQALARERFVVVEIRDREHRPLVPSNPRYAALERELATQGHHFPDDDRLHYWRTTLLDSTLIQIACRCTRRRTASTAISTGIRRRLATLAQLRSDLVHALAITLFAVLLTTMALYPVILSLNCKVLEFSREVVRGNLEMASVLGAAIAKRDSGNQCPQLPGDPYSDRPGSGRHRHGVDAGARSSAPSARCRQDRHQRQHPAAGPAHEAEFAIMCAPMSRSASRSCTIRNGCRRYRKWSATIEKFDGSGYPHRAGRRRDPAQCLHFRHRR